MKKAITTLALMFCAGAGFAQVSTNALVFSNQAIAVDPQYLEVNAVTFGDVEVDGVTHQLWTITAIFTLPRGHVYDLGGHDCILQSFRCAIPVTATEEELQAVLADSYDAVKFAVTNGRYRPTGKVTTGLLSVVAAKLSQSL